MTTFEIIANKRDGRVLSREEINFFIQNYTNGDIPDYQMSALLMAIYLKGMNFEETAHLTNVMLHSGETIDLSNISGEKIDKHSTGGVGDKISLILAPLIAAAGVKVPMISGRGLAFTGGTLDKLESIPGFRTNLSPDEFKDNIKNIGVSIIGQTDKIVPADKKIYALRDTTATIDSVPLITASILSKKLAEGINGLVLDIKVGNGAFMRDINGAEILAKNMIETAKLNNLKATALLTNMSQPLGKMAGNWLEVKESIQVLRGQGPSDLTELTLILGARMLMLADPAIDQDLANNKLTKILHNGQAFEKFLELVQIQGGDISYINNPEKYSKAGHTIELTAKQSGYIHNIDTKAIGTMIVDLGGGRHKKTDKIDFTTGVELYKKCGEHVDAGEKIAAFYTNKLIPDLNERINRAIKISAHKPEQPPLLLKVIQ